MSESMVARYWCHVCSQIVNPIMEVEIKCPFCQNGFVEELDSSSRDHDMNPGSPSDRGVSLWAPIVLNMVGNPRRRRFRREENNHESQEQGDLDQEQRNPDVVLRRRGNSILHLLQGLRDEISSESETSENDRGERERVILINPFNQAIVLEGSFNLNQTQNRSENTPGSLGDYFIGSGLDLLLQHLAENDPNSYGTPPARKEAIESMPTVKIGENLQCSICLDDFEIGEESKEMPCKHKFHSGCILPWLELHSSCPVCRFQMPADESKLVHSNGSVNNTNIVENSVVNSERESEGRNGNGRSWVPMSWINALFSSSGSSNGGNGSSPPSSTSSSANAPHRDEN